MGFATEPMSSNRMPRRLQTGAASSPATIANSLQKQQQQWPGPPPPYASPAAVASAARFLAERAKVTAAARISLALSVEAAAAERLELPT